MYKYELPNQYDRSIPITSTIYVPTNDKGFADILSINLEDTIRLRKAKNKINEINPFLWEDIKKYTNPYELIYIFNNKINKKNIHSNELYINNTDTATTAATAATTADNNGITKNNIKSISQIKPLSRSFFKMIEIVYEFIPNIYNNLNLLPVINSLHIAEGPGGFIEATRYIRKLVADKHNEIIQQDKAFGITLIDNTRRNVPAWKQSNIFLKQHPEVIISTGVDGTGNIYNIDNILSLEKLILHHTNNNDNIVDDVRDVRDGIVDFITADGGFDYSIDYNYQEQASSKLIFCEIITALKYQRMGGNFVCKFFDINSYITVEMLYILYLAYDKITIYKPLTSRIANSEKYIICNNFIGVDTIFIDKLFRVLDEWNNNAGLNTINQLFTEIPTLFIDKIKDINKQIINIQIHSINNIINIINTKTNLNKEWKKENLKNQINNAINWCIRYNIPFMP